MTSVGRRRKIAIPQIVMHALKMPDALAGVGVEREQAIGEEIVAEAVARRRNRMRRIRWAHRRCRASASTVMPAQLLAAPLVFHASFGQVS